MDGKETISRIRLAEAGDSLMKLNEREKIIALNRQMLYELESETLYTNSNMPSEWVKTLQSLFDVYRLKKIQKYTKRREDGKESGETIEMGIYIEIYREILKKMYKFMFTKDDIIFPDRISVKKEGLKINQETGLSHPEEHSKQGKQTAQTIKDMGYKVATRGDFKNIINEITSISYRNILTLNGTHLGLDKSYGISGYSTAQRMKEGHGLIAEISEKGRIRCRQELLTNITNLLLIKNPPEYEKGKNR